MTTFDVNTGEIRRFATLAHEYGQALSSIASILRAAADSAGATGDATSAAALRGFILQWGDELAQYAEHQVTLAADMVAVASLYESTEILAAESFRPASP